MPSATALPSGACREMFPRLHHLVQRRFQNRLAHPVARLIQWRAWLLVGCLGLTAWPAANAAPVVLTINDPDGLLGRIEAPVCSPVNLTPEQRRAAAEHRLRLQEMVAGAKRGPQIMVQFEPTDPARGAGRLWWLMPPGTGGQRAFAVEEGGLPFASGMQAKKDLATGRWNIREAGKPVLGYNYQTNEPGDVLERVSADNRKYARARSDYIHPLYGPDGEELTKDWSLDHPHQRGLYWAWPEVDYHGERGDLHALQRVFARPTGQCAALSGPLFARIDAENQWLWEDQEAIVRERAIIRAWRAGPGGRIIDLEFQFTALKDDVAIARRETKLYGGLNIRLAAVQDQRIDFHTDPPEAQPRMAWAGLYGGFPGGQRPVRLEVFQRQTNPDYPGDWVKYPELNWFQPTFPAFGTRYVLKKDATLVLQFRLRLRWTTDAPAVTSKDEWRAYHATPTEPLSPAR